MVEEVNVKHALIDEDSIFDLAQSQVAEKIKDVRFLTRGLNDTYKVVGKESFYAYRIYRHGWRNEAAIKFELDAILHLKNKGYEGSRTCAGNRWSLCKENSSPRRRPLRCVVFSRSNRP